MGLLACGEGVSKSTLQDENGVPGMGGLGNGDSPALHRSLVDEFKSEIIRLPLGIDDGGTPYNWNDEKLVRSMIVHARKRGIYVIVDWHSHGADKNVNAAKEYFGRIAKDYGKYDNVVFEIFNEPINQTWEQVKSYAEQVLPVIREHSDNLVLVGTPMYSQQFGWAAGNLLNDKNVAYVLHFHAKSHTGWLRTEGNTALNSGKCLFVSEWGATHAPIHLKPPPSLRSEAP
jgi:endoglucanase